MMTNIAYVDASSITLMLPVPDAPTVLVPPSGVPLHTQQNLVQSSRISSTNPPLADFMIATESMRQLSNTAERTTRDRQQSSMRLVFERFLRLDNSAAHCGWCFSKCSVCRCLCTTCAQPRVPKSTPLRGSSARMNLAGSHSGCSARACGLLPRSG